MFHLCKQTRAYRSEPYCGYTSDYKPAEYDDIESARVAVSIFNKINPVGWNIYDAISGELVDGIDFFDSDSPSVIKKGLVDSDVAIPNLSCCG